MKSAIIASVFVLLGIGSLPVAYAHPGHGETDPASTAHLLELPHVLWILGVVALMAAALGLARRRRRRRRS